MLHGLVLAALPLLSLVLTAPAYAGGPLWQDTVFAGGRDGQADAIVTDGERVYAAGFAATATGEVGIVRSYQAPSGAVLWEDRPVDDAAATEVDGLALDGGRLFATALVTRAADAGGFDWLLRAYDAPSGTLLWQDARDDGDFGEAAGIAATNGRVFVTGSASAPGARSAFVVRAYDGATGTLLWQDLHGDGGGYDVGFALATDTGVVFAAGRVGDGLHVTAYAQDTGAVLWTHDRPDGFPTVDGLAVAGGRVFVATVVGAELRVYAFAAATGSPLWRYRESATGTGPGSRAIFDVGLAATSEHVIVGRVAGGAGALLALDAATGGALWRRDDPGVTRSLQIGGGRVFGVAGASALLARAFDVASGAPLWSSPLDRDGSALALARSASLVFVAGVAGPGFGSFHVAAFDTARGALLPVLRRASRLPRVR